MLIKRGVRYTLEITRKSRIEARDVAVCYCTLLDSVAQIAALLANYCPCSNYIPYSDCIPYNIAGLLQATACRARGLLQAAPCSGCVLLLLWLRCTTVRCYGYPQHPSTAASFNVLQPIKIGCGFVVVAATKNPKPTF